MKKIAFILFLFSGLIYGEEKEIDLKSQAIIDMCNYPDLTEGIVDLLYLSVDNFWHYGEYSKIFPLFYLITKILPTDVNAYVMGGWFLINGIAPKYKGKEKERIKNYAVEFMKKGIEKNPNDYRLYFELAWFYYNEGKFEEAIEYLNIAENFPHPFYVESLKGHIYTKRNEKEKAINVWEKIKEKYPEMKDIAERNLKRLKGER